MTWSRLWKAIRPWPFKPPELFLLSALLIVGPAFVFAIPVGAGWDEETHVVRVWEIAALHFIPNELPRNELPFPAIYWNLSYRRPLLIRPVDDRTFWTETFDAAIGEQGYIYGDLRTRSVYSPALLLPQAFAMRYLGMARDLPALPVFYASRLLGLISYSALAWLGVRLVPFGKWVLALCALAPTAVFQAATISADPISNGLGYLFVGGTLAISGRRQLGWREWGTLIALFALLFLGKINLIPLGLLPFVTTRPSNFRMKAGYLLLAGAAVLLALLEVGGWAAIGYPKLDTTSTGADPAAQLSYSISHPGALSKTLILDLAAHGIPYLKQWIAEYGYEYWAVPLATYPLFALALMAAYLSDARGRRPPATARVGLAILFLAGCLTTLLSLYLADTPVASEEIAGVQGRYFAPFAPLLLMALVGRSPKHDLERYPNWAKGLLASCLLVYGLGLVLAYHIRCGTAYFQLGLCYQPEYKNWDPNARYSGPISESLSLTQEIVPECDGLKEIRVWVDSTGAARSGSTEFSVYGPEARKPMVTGTVPNERLPQGGWYALQFDPDWQSLGNVYRLTIQAGPPKADSGPRIAYTLRPEYEAGALYENADPVGIDLVFKYGCVAGLERFMLTVLDSALG